MAELQLKLVLGTETRKAPNLPATVQELKDVTKQFHGEVPFKF
jgi:hypothetical protein